MGDDFATWVGRIMVVIGLVVGLSIASTWLYKAVSPAKLVGFTISSNSNGGSYRVFKVVTNWPDEVLTTTDNIERAIEIVGKLNDANLVEY